MSDRIKKIDLSAMFLAIGLLLPLLTGQIEKFGSMMLPMHIPVLLCGFICGWQYGLAVGVILPVLRAATFGMPVMYPQAVAMLFELGTYGFLSGFIYNKFSWTCLRAVYRSLIAAMLGGRIVWGIAMVVILGIDGFSLEAFTAAAFVNALPGIIIQLVLIPAILLALSKAHIGKPSKK